MLNPILHQAIRENGGVITTHQVQMLGFSKTLLTNYIKTGELDRVAHGIYILPDEIEDDMYTLKLRSKKLIFSHASSLFIFGLSERTPFIHSVTFPSNAAIPRSIQSSCKCFYIKPELHCMGLVEKPNTFGHIVKCYNPERTICDLLRSRSRLDEETVLSALKRYAVSKGKNLYLLADYSRKLMVFNVLKGYMDVLL
jgi:predicted transcriptional regulator of viral defense system